MKKFTINQIREIFLNHFKEKGHVVGPEVPLVSKDKSTLFIIAGMQPLKDYLMGKPSPMGNRVVTAQRCIRTNDIESIGDNRHITNFVMMGHFSFQDYFKRESVEWTLEFFCDKLGLDKNKMYVTCFEGNKDAPKDYETAEIWKSVGIPDERIFFLGKKDNWWEVEGSVGPAGPDTELFYDTGIEKCSNHCIPGCSCNKFVEVCNNVFMQYKLNEDGTYTLQDKPNVDSGFGLERICCVVNGYQSVFETDIYFPTMQKLSQLSGSTEEDEKNRRIISDHLRSSIFLIHDGVLPSNAGEGYILRRLIRRTVRKFNELGIELAHFENVVEEMIENFITTQFCVEMESTFQHIKNTLINETRKFQKTITKGEKELLKYVENCKQNNQKMLDSKLAFKLYDTFGYPIELTQEILKQYGIGVNLEEFKALYKKHQEKSRGTSAKGGLENRDYEAVKLHTATHLLNYALRKLFGTGTNQRGSNINSERLRFDFNLNKNVSPEEVKQLEDIVNQMISQEIDVKHSIMSYEEAKNINAVGVFTDKYDDQVSVYNIGNLSIELCGGPHVKNTGELGQFKITNVGSIGAGIKRIRAVLENN